LFLSRRFRRNGEEHPLPFQLRQQFHFPIIFKRLRETEQKDLALLLVYDGPALAMHVRPHLFTCLPELDGMLQLELGIMVTGIGTEADFLDHRLLSVRFDLFLFLLLFINELAVINDLANGRVSIWRDLHQIEFQFISQLQCLARGIYPLLYIVSHQAYLRYPDVFIDPMFWLLLFKWRPWAPEPWSF